jgi:monofunctional biosynthetic peptidoglycan transglycosylase
MNIGSVEVLAAMAAVLLLFVACAAPDSYPAAVSDGAKTHPHRRSEKTLFDFARGPDIDSWRVVDDAVMGGLSRSGLAPSSDGSAVFAGDISLVHWGGFSAVRSPLDDYDLGGCDGLDIHLKGDGKTYKVFLKTNRRDDGYQYQADIPTRAGQWLDVHVPFDQFRPTYRGMRMLWWPGVDPSKITAIGLMISDKQEGPFALEVRWIKAERK